jgi:predicted alpha/beta superfamily hydrolase
MRARSLLVLALLGCAVPQADPTSSPVPGADDRKAAQVAHVVVHYPTGWGHFIAVRGNGAGLSWDQGTAASWSTGDVWRLDVQVTRPIELKPLVDDATWAMGPNWTLGPGQTLDIWPHFFHGQGRLERRAGWYSSGLDDSRDIVVYLPPSYDENAGERYPVVYMHDGANLFYDSESFIGVSWDVEGAMDRGVADASIREAIIVGVYSDANRIWELTPTDGGYGGGGADRYLGFIADELKPEIDRQYRTLADRDSTGIMGSSLGGLASVYAGVTRSEVFGLVGALSPSTWWDGTLIIGRVQGEAHDPDRVYVDSGDAGDSMDDVADTAKLAQAYRDHGATLDYLVQHGGQHSEVYWRQRTPGALAFLLGGR